MGKWLKKIDLRNVDSGTPSSSMVWENVSHWALFPVGIFDIFKSAIPCWLGKQLGFDINIIILTGIAAIIGHNWSIFLNLNGGRGLSTILGVLLVIFPLGFPWMLFFLGIGFLLGDSAPWALLSLFLLPVFMHFEGSSQAILWSAPAILIITIIKRLEANRRLLPEKPSERRFTIFLRIVFDRDIRSHKDWIHRKSIN